MRLHPKIEKCLNDTGLPWIIELGKRHRHIRMRGRLVAILPITGPDDRKGAGINNLCCQIKRAAREMGAKV